MQDPFNLKPYEGPPGTKDKPLEVFSMFDDRIMGCVCKCLIIWDFEGLLVRVTLAGLKSKVCQPVRLVSFRVGYQVSQWFLKEINDA